MHANLTDHDPEVENRAVGLHSHRYYCKESQKHEEIFRRNFAAAAKLSVKFALICGNLLQEAFCNLVPESFWVR